MVPENFGNIQQRLFFKTKRGGQELLPGLRGDPEGFPHEGKGIANRERGGGENRGRRFGKHFLLQDRVDLGRGAVKKNRMLVDFIPVDQRRIALFDNFLKRGRGFQRAIDEQFTDRLLLNRGGKEGPQLIEGAYDLPGNNREFLTDLGRDPAGIAPGICAGGETDDAVGG